MSRFALVVFALLALSPARGAEIVSIAAAANFAYALDALNAEFKKFSPKTSVVVATGASGSLVAQIKNGAPYDVFLSADLDYAKALIAADEADAKSLTIFATGRLVLWTTRPGIELKSVADTVRNPAVKKLAIANRRAKGRSWIGTTASTGCASARLRSSSSTMSAWSSCHGTSM